MESVTAAIIAVLASLLGFGLAWWFGRHLAATRFAEGAHSRDAEVTLLQEALQRERREREQAQVQIGQVQDKAQSRLDDLALRLQQYQELSAKSESGHRVAETALQSAEAQIGALNLRLQEMHQLTMQNTALERALAEARAKADEQARTAEVTRQWLTQAREVLGEQFQALSASILDTKAQHLSERQSEQLQHLLKPFREQIESFQRDVREATRLDLEGRVELKGELKQLKDLNQTLSEEAHALTRALRSDAKKRGNWGELVLKRLLELAGLTQGREYLLQQSVQGIERSTQIPDVLIRLTDERSLIIDSKLSLLAYQELVNSESDEDRERWRKELRQSMRTHIEDLGRKRYADTPDLRTLEFVVMFVPVEAAYLEAVGADDSLYELALSRNVVLASPGMLLGLLRVVSQLWRVQERQSNAEDIARRAGELYDSFVRVAENLQQTLNKLDGSRDELAEAIKRISSGRNNLVVQVERLKGMGAKASKQMPAALLQDAEAMEPLLPAPDSESEPKA
ncbi:hypothetical protein C7S18_03715 [Ahniella affigens]|uniref:DNA recombination protein RmuC n=1 Tax=Ahniella affigens TaxID=2021234 RepID=A0A2P1PNC4_9GAMM|nr:DNA recombination protein RmuC [Ahniella affigens]AVP96350.1 hypothetical protein C7S18_03715 [Ahniella affigens]